MAPPLKTFRLITLSVVSFFSLVVLALGAHAINTTRTFTGGSYSEYSALAVATAVLSLVSLPPMLGIDMTRTGAFTSWVAVEFGVLCFLWIMWLATGAKTASDYSLSRFSDGRCSIYLYSDIRALCGEVPTIMALSFFNWIILKAYSITLLVCAIQGQSRGHANVWTSSVKQGDFLGPAPPPGQPPLGVEQKQGMMYPPQPVGYGTPPPPSSFGHTTPPSSYGHSQPMPYPQPFAGTMPSYPGSPPPQAPYTVASPPPPQGSYPQV